MQKTTLQKRCLHDGHEFEGEGFSYPNSRKANGKFGFSVNTFCHPSCEKAYVDKIKTSPHLLNWLHLHLHRDLGIEEAIPIAPDPTMLACNRRDGQGMTIEQFRDFGRSHRITEKISHLPIDKRVWVQERQVDCDIPFYEVIRSEKLVAAMLFEDHKAKGLPIPKTLLNEATANEEKMRMLKQNEDERQAAQQLPHNCAEDVSEQHGSEADGAEWKQEQALQAADFVAAEQDAQQEESSGEEDNEEEQQESTEELENTEEQENADEQESTKAVRHKVSKRRRVALELQCDKQPRKRQ